MRLLENKTMLITGGSRGIGAGIVRMAMQEGAQVALIFQRDADAANELSQEMVRLHPQQRCLPFQCDVTDVDAMRETVKSVTQAFGRLDCLVNNAGVTRDAALARMRRDQWDEVIATNLGSMFNATQPLVLQFVKQRSGSIINMTSFAGVFGSPAQTNYAASKAGIIGFTRSLSKEVASFGVRVNAVAPGIIETDMLSMLDDERMKFIRSQIGSGRLGTCDDVAHLVCFLASDRSSYITGQCIQIDGGLVM